MRVAKALGLAIALLVLVAIGVFVDWPPDASIPTMPGTVVREALPLLASCVAIGLVLVGLRTLVRRWRGRERGGPALAKDEPKKAVARAADAPAIAPAPLEIPRAGASILAVEAYSSAGPRKSPKDYDNPELSPHDLCEDAAGVLATGTGFLWWLSDGTSNGSYLPPVGNHAGLTTRMLARDLGDAFMTAQLVVAPGDTSVRMLKDVESLWYDRLYRYLEQLLEAGAWDEFKAKAPRNSDGALQFKWSSTFMGGVIDRAGEGMTVYQAGDSGALIVRRMGGITLVETILPTKDRITVRALISDGALQVDVFAGDRGALPVDRFDGVHAFFAMSDGLTKGDLAAYLPSLQGLAANRSVAELRTGLLQRRDKSYDDKSLVIGRMMELP